MSCSRTHYVLITICLLLSAAPRAWAQDAPAAAAPAAPAAPDKPPLTQEELDQMLAPLALYPDSLLSQVLMASTYPLEVVEADRWLKANPNLKGDALAVELEKQTWDPSVKSLVNFPEVLGLMSEQLNTTVKIGDAFIDDQARVMNTVQQLRAKAQSAGNLKSNEQQKVIVEAPPPDATTTTTQIIKIESPSPEVVYVPTYNPTVVYGTWPYPSYPPYPYYPPRPPGYVATAAISFGVGVACGAAWGYAWGGCNWGHGDVDIDVNRNTNINNTRIDRNKYQNQINNNRTNVKGGNRSNSFQHNPAHRQGVPYRDNKSAQKFGGASDARAAQAREQYRGRADAGRQEIARGGADQFKGNNPANRAGAGNRDNVGQNRAGANQGNLGQNRAGANQGNVGQNRAGAGNANRSAGAAQNRAPSSGSKGSAFSGTNRSGSQTRADSQRGQASRSASRSASPSRSGGGSRGGASRGGGGGGRGGGGGGGRGRSDIAMKENFAPVDPQETLRMVLTLPITTWNYKDDSSTRHLGPMAQDFYSAFGLGSDDKTIGFLDEGGVALSAVQGLNQRIVEQDAQIAALKAELAELKALTQKQTAISAAGKASGN